MDIGASFGGWLEKRRKALDLTREELARKVGCSASALRKIESDERRPSKQLAELLANILEVPAEERETFIQIARGELSIERMKIPLPLPDLNLLQSSQAFSPQIPIPPTPLIGREIELSTIRQMLEDPQCRLITLIGSGGIGKTHLAIEAARREEKTFAQGGFFVSLASLNSPDFIAPAIASALRLKFSGSADPVTQLLEQLRNKQFLLVLDNFEHLLDGADLISRIMECTPDAKLLLTSREPLNIRGEWVFEVQGLSVPAPNNAETLEDSSAVRLFVNCARRNRAVFTL